MERKTGARGLRTIMETILLETMYQLPSLKNVSKVVVDESVVLGHAPPYVVYKTEGEKTEEPRRAGIAR
jgi:ATP-dependent Clp protease ATP-binding subunit ClpX